MTYFWRIPACRLVDLVDLVVRGEDEQDLGCRHDGWFQIRSLDLDRYTELATTKII